MVDKKSMIQAVEILDANEAPVSKLWNCWTYVKTSIVETGYFPVVYGCGAPWTCNTPSSACGVNADCCDGTCNGSRC
jgi:hypothetical protein